MLGCHLVGEASEIRFKGQDGVLEGQLLIIEGVQAAESQLMLAQHLLVQILISSPKLIYLAGGVFSDLLDSCFHLLQGLRLTVGQLIDPLTDSIEYFLKLSLEVGEGLGAEVKLLQLLQPGFEVFYDILVGFSGDIGIEYVSELDGKVVLA